MIILTTWITVVILELLGDNLLGIALSSPRALQAMQRNLQLMFQGQCDR